MILRGRMDSPNNADVDSVSSTTADTLDTEEFAQQVDLRYNLLDEYCTMAASWDQRLEEHKFLAKLRTDVNTFVAQVKILMKYMKKAVHEDYENTGKRSELLLEFDKDMMSLAANYFKFKTTCQNLFTEISSDEEEEAEEETANPDEVDDKKEIANTDEVEHADTLNTNEVDNKRKRL